MRLGPKMLNTANRRLDWVPTIADITKPTPEELNAGVNLTCRVTVANYQFGVTGTNIITDPSPCDTIEAGAPGMDTFEAGFDMFRFKEEADDVAWTTFTRKGLPGYLVERIGQVEEGQKAEDAPYKAGDEVAVMEGLTLSPRPMSLDNAGYEKFRQEFAPQSFAPRAVVATAGG
ncbi:hypothetical protein [Glutamicibacter sp. V16R2B1]|uniref:phage tail tube protein n=1 Tax=Glutamicibacter sp. V16R2B1 TaxID=2036207 RepID=UPI0010FE37FE|nr:hypothetical protein [Glutamicibacter sp. V16R2B1]TLK56317.1 hypothetical protein FDN03_02385 [Glutamicibacter sp. V16R2B1]